MINRPDLPYQPNHPDQSSGSTVAPPASAPTEMLAHRGASIGTGARTLALFSCKGGVGTTFLTAQLGYVLAQSRQRRVLLVDCVYPYGDLGVMLGESTPTGSLSDLVRNPGRIDGHLLESVLAHPYPHLAVLSGCGLVCLSRDDLRRGLCRVLELARARFDLIVLDCGRQPEPACQFLLQGADDLIPVLRPTLPMLRDARQLLISLRSQGISRERIVPVLNCPRRGSIALVQALEQALGCPLVHRIPEYTDLVRGSAMTGVPVPHQFPGHRLSQSIVHLGQVLMGEEKSAEPDRGRFWRGWWRVRKSLSASVVGKVQPTAMTLPG